MTGSSYKSQQLKNYNRISLLNIIRRSKFITKAELAAATGLTFMAIKKNMEELMELNLVREDALKSQGVGRKAVTYTINESYGYTIGLHINMFKTCVAVSDLGGNIVALRILEKVPAYNSQYEYIDFLFGLIQEVLHDPAVPQDKILGLGIGVPGPVNGHEGIVLTPPNFSIIRFMPLKKIMEEKFHIPVYVQKDTNALAFGEYWHGAGKGIKSLVYIDADVGIGSSLVINGEIYEGAHFSAGEFGHITLDINGPRCNCGNKGCLEAMGSGIAIVRDIRQLLETNPSHFLYEKRHSLTLADVLDAAAQNDLLCISTLNTAATYMGIAINSLINLIDPERIIIGGVLANEYNQYMDIVRPTIFTKHVDGGTDELVVPAHLASHAGVIGACELVAHNFFSSLVGEVIAKE